MRPNKVLAYEDNKRLWELWLGTGSFSKCKEEFGLQGNIAGYIATAGRDVERIRRVIEEAK